MSRLAERLILLGLAVTCAWSTIAADPPQSLFPGIGRTATDDELAAWDIDVRPDFKGLPPGSGSVFDGEELWLTRCATCHGDFGDGARFFSPLVLGNITEEDIASGHVAALLDPSRVRTTMMKVPTVSTLWDYINRAMPWNNPKSLTTDEVYAVTAYLLSLAEVVDEDFVLDQDTIRQVQDRMPNRLGMTTDHGMWKVEGKPDTQNTACMRDCAGAAVVTSSIPDFARNAHGNLALQSRSYGPFRGIDTDPAGVAESAAPVATASGLNLVRKSGCTACHAVDKQLVGPAFNIIAARHSDKPDLAGYLEVKIRSGGSGVWGGTMPPQPQLEQADAEQIATWLAAMVDSQNSSATE